MLFARGTLATIGVCVALSCAAQSPIEEAAYKRLESNILWCHESAINKVNSKLLEECAKAIAPIRLRVIVIKALSDKWVANGEEARGSYAQWLLLDRLQLENTILIVYTKQGLTGYSQGVDLDQLQKLSARAYEMHSDKTFTPAIIWLATEIADLKTPKPAHPAAPTTGVQRSAAVGPPPALTFGIGFVGAIVAAVLFDRSSKVRRQRLQLGNLQSEAEAAIQFLAAYDELINDQRYYTSIQELITQAKKHAELSQSAENLALKVREASLAFHHADLGKTLIQKACWGSTFAAKPLPNINAVNLTEAPLLTSSEERCFFTLLPMAQMLPCIVAWNGVRRTVYASPEAISKLREGFEPEIGGKPVHLLEPFQGFLPPKNKNFSND